jgi:hypothetical protein
MSRTPARVTQADVARAIRDGETFIYFLRSGDFIKIGYSGDWRRRMSDMQIGSPYTITPLLVLIGRIEDERNLHTRFRASHFRGEWFHNTQAIRSFIKEHRSECVAKLHLNDIRTRRKAIAEEIIL